MNVLFGLNVDQWALIFGTFGKANTLSDSAALASRFREEYGEYPDTSGHTAYLVDGVFKANKRDMSAAIDLMRIGAMAGFVDYRK